MFVEKLSFILVNQNRLNYYSRKNPVDFLKSKYVFQQVNSKRNRRMPKYYIIDNLEFFRSSN
jgi:hypothetical protein